MINTARKITTDLVLAGGGHAHVQVIKAFAMKPAPGLRVTLISPDPHTPYSGMLPGLIAGHYTFDETHIDLNALCRFAGVRFIRGEVTGLDMISRRVQLAQRPPLAYDFMSIDTGATPATSDVPGAPEFAVPVKPIAQFLTRWNELIARATQTDKTLTVAVVGAGAGGVELILSAQHALDKARQGAGLSAQTEFHLFSSEATVLPGTFASLQEKFTRLLRHRGVHIHTGQRAVRVEHGLLHISDGNQYKADEILWVTAAAAPHWPGEAGLAVDDAGFIAINNKLQSISHTNVFAAGDIASMMETPHPKAGVFAVRQGAVLAVNLRRAARGETLKAYKPQKNYLKLISTGGKYAVATRNKMILSGAWVWQWKDWIDRRFMARFNALPDMPASTSLRARLRDAIAAPALDDADMRCGGCGGKMSSDVLARALSGLAPVKRDDILIGLDARDDAAAVMIPASMIAIHTIDAFRPMIDDPYVFGKITASHALGDLHAMGAQPQTALAIVTLPPDAPAIIESDLAQMMQGAVDVFNAAGAALVGGHTGEGAEIMLGFAVNGFADPAKLLHKSGARPGDQLIFTKPLGTGALLAADMRHKAKGRHIAAAIDSMLHSNASAAQVLVTNNATACTDVTGFGLAGHLLEMLRASAVSAKLLPGAIVALDGVRAAMDAGIFSTLHEENARAADFIDSRNFAADEFSTQLLFDPQTAGGLLASVPAQNTQSCLDSLHLNGYPNARIIGEIVAESSAPRITLNKQAGGRVWESNPPETLNAPHRF